MTDTTFISKLRQKEQITSTVNEYEEFFDNKDDANKRQGQSDVLTNDYYDLVTDFYEYGCTKSFHFAQMFKDSSFIQSITRHEDFLALKLGLKEDMVCLDVGCGVGGPMREIAKFTGCNVVGLNNNDYQIKRSDYHCKVSGLDKQCTAVKGDFEKMPFENESFDAAYAIEATCHARDLRNPYGQVYQKLKPGAYFACYEWLVTPSYDPENPKHREVIHDLEKGNGISKLFGIPDCLEALRDVGFEIIEHKDLSIVQESQEPWYVPLKGSYSLSFDQLYRWRMNPLGRSITNVMVYGLETLRLVPKGTVKVSQFLNNGADALVKAGEMEIFTPMFFFLARKPE